MVVSTKKTAKKQWIVAIATFSAFIGLLVFGMWVSDPNKGKPDPREAARKEAAEVRIDYKARSLDAVTPKERWISKSEKELADYKMENRQLKQDYQSMQKQVQEILSAIRNGDLKSASLNAPASGSSSPAEGLLPPPPNIQNVPVMPPGGMNPSTNPDLKESIAANILPPGPQSQGSSGSNKGPKKSAIQVFSFDEETTGAKTKKSKNISHFLPSGSFGKVVLLSGVDAPTGGEAANNPVPILMRLLDLGTLPNYFHSEIRDCHVTGDVSGNLSSEKGKIRTEKLSCVLINGDVIEVNIKGWVNGEDGSEGFRGKVVEKAGALLARTFFAGTFSGIGNSVAMQYQNVSQSALGSVTSVNPSDVGKAGLATGISTSMEKLSDYYMERANEMYPIIEIGANRIGELVLSEGVDLERNIIGNIGGQL